MTADTAPDTTPETTQGPQAKRADVTNRPRSNAFHLQMEQNMDESVLESMLKRAGIPFRVIRTVTPLHEGVSFTHLLAEGHWDHGSGAAQCDGGCRDKDVRHVPYQGLSQEQRSEFHSDLGRGLQYYCENLHSLADGAFRSMDEVAMTPCQGNPQEENAKQDWNHPQSR